MTTTYFMRFWSLIALLFFLVAVSAQKAANIDVPEVYRTKVEKALIAAKDHRTTLERVLRDTPNDMKEGAAFLIAYMPQLEILHTLDQHFGIYCSDTELFFGKYQVADGQIELVLNDWKKVVFDTADKARFWKLFGTFQRML